MSKVQKCAACGEALKFYEKAAGICLRCEMSQKPKNEDMTETMRRVERDDYYETR